MYEWIRIREWICDWDDILMQSLTKSARPVNGQYLRLYLSLNYSLSDYLIYLYFWIYLSFLIYLIGIYREYVQLNCSEFVCQL